MDIVSALRPIARRLAEYVFIPLFYYNSNFKDLERQCLSLVDARDRVQHSVDEAERNGLDIERDVIKWLKKANEVIEEAQKFLEDNGGEWNCLANLCPNLFQRHQLSEKAKRITNEIAEIYEGRTFEGVSYRRSSSMDWSSTLPGYVTFESRDSIMKEILEAVENPDYKLIGVYGMGGVGKTTLVDEIVSRVAKMRLFDKFAKLTISQTPNVEDIQEQLIEMLGLKLEQKTKQGRATFLRKMLPKTKILIVLDDLWKGLKLEELGIPSMDDCKGCKIIITSREEHVLSNEMNTVKNFEVKVLSEEDSWKVFKNIVGEDVETNHEWKEIAIEIVKKCGRLPIALVVVAKALKGKPIFYWKDALSQLKNPRISMEIKGVSKDLYSSLVLSYKFLESDEAKSVFLLCSMFPEDYDINIDIYLLTYVMGLGLLLGTNTLGDARDRILKLVYDLKSCCLLLKSDKGDNYVKMHDVIRDVAIGIASKNEKIRTLSYGKELNEWKDEHIERNYTAIWVDYLSMLPNLRKKLRFQKLELLALRGGEAENLGGKLHISEALFEGIGNLKVLWVEEMYLFPWPSSFLHLTHLKTLSLIDCELGNIDIIGDLKELEILNLSHSDIKELPKSIDQLLELKLLDVSYCAKLQHIPPNVISRLTKLEVLHTKGGFSRWEKADLSQCDGKNASLLELNYLPLLTNLSLKVRNADILSEGTFSVNLRLNSFEIVIGKMEVDRRMLMNPHESSGVLDIKMESISILLDGGLNKLLKKCEQLILAVRQNGNDVLSELDRSDSPHLKQLCLINNSDIAYLCVGGMMFSILEKLVLYSMRGLESIIDGPIKTIQVSNKLKTIHVLRCNKLRNLFPLSLIECLSNLEVIWVNGCEMMESIIDGPIKTIQVFNNLKTIHVFKCNKLRNLLPLSLIECLSNLEEIKVEYCEMMETIFEVESEEDVNNRVECRQLRKLTLWRLPRLMSICSKLRENDTEIEEDHQLFNPQVAFPNLEILSIEEISNLRMIWHPKQVFGSNDFCKLHRIELIKCDDMRIVFTYNVMKNLNQLQYLDIRDCDSVEEIFEIQRSDAIEKEDSFSVKLETLILSELPNLKKVWSNDLCGIFNFQCLKSIDFRDCPNLRSIFPTSLIKDLQRLQRINISNCGIQEIFCMGETPQMVSFPHIESIKIIKVDNLEMIWHKQLIVDDLSKLETILLHDCKNLKSVLQSNEIILTKLKCLDIENCDSLEEVFGVEEEESEIVVVKSNHIHFENLQKVKVNGCPKLKRLVPFYLTSQFHRQLQSLQVDYYGLDVVFANLKRLPSLFLPTQDAFSNLRKFKLKSKKEGIRESWLSKFSRELFLTLKVLHFDGLNDNEGTHSLSALNPLLYHLEKLKVCNAFLLEIFSDDIEKKQRRKSYALLKRLILKNLPKLMHIWNEISHLFFENLEYIKVKKCSSLKILVQSSSFSLQNLMKLKISECHGLIYLLNSSVAKTLVQLQKMTLQNCKCMTTVLAREEINEEEEDDEIVFNKLEELKLYELPELEKFQAEEKCTLKFPSLKRFVIMNCPEMKTFSPGVVCTRLLKAVIIPEDFWDQEIDIWDGNVNDTLRKLWEDDDSVENKFKEENASVVLENNMQF